MYNTHKKVSIKVIDYHHLNNIPIVTVGGMVLEKKVLSDQGKTIVREHVGDRDAQTVYKKIVQYYIRSTKESLREADILSYITSAKLSSGKWKGSTTRFILNWQDKIRQYENLVDNTN